MPKVTTQRVKPKGVHLVPGSMNLDPEAVRWVLQGHEDLNTILSRTAALPPLQNELGYPAALRPPSGN